MGDEEIARVRRLKEQLDRGDLPGPEDVRFLAERCDAADKRIREVIDLLAQTRNTFRSKQVERARKILEELL
jgi:hypothetical protein